MCELLHRPHQLAQFHFSVGQTQKTTLFGKMSESNRYVLKPPQFTVGTTYPCFRQAAVNYSLATANPQTALPFSFFSVSMSLEPTLGTGAAIISPLAALITGGAMIGSALATVVYAARIRFHPRRRQVEESPSGAGTTSPPVALDTSPPREDIHSRIKSPFIDSCTVVLPDSMTLVSETVRLPHWLQPLQRWGLIAPVQRPPERKIEDVTAPCTCSLSVKDTDVWHDCCTRMHKVSISALNRPMKKALDYSLEFLFIWILMTATAGIALALNILFVSQSFINLELNDPPSLATLHRWMLL